MLIGRAYAYGLAAAGQAGVERAIKILRDDVERTLPPVGLRLGAGIEYIVCESPCDWRKVADA